MLDLPGLFDTKGAQQEIINAYAFSMIFKGGRSFRFVLMTEVASLYDRRGGTLVDIFKMFERLLG